MAESFLKNAVRRRARPGLVAGAVILNWINFGMPLHVNVLAPSDSSWPLKFLAPLLSIVVMAVDSIPGPYVKAVLVFWRVRDPLPGSRVFDKAQLDRDPRIDKARLRARAGGRCPQSALEQNRLWYKLYRTVENDARALGVHKDYLVLRDITWFSVLLLIAALASAAIVRTPSSAWATLACTLLYVLIRHAAAERGARSVGTVLALVSSRPDPASDAAAGPRSS